MKPTTQAGDDIDISEQYDQESDVYYVTVKTGEPSIVVEHDDALLIEVGLFTRLPTGFRILNYTKYRKHARPFREDFKKICRSLGLRKLKDERESQQRQIDRAFEKAVAA